MATTWPLFANAFSTTLASSVASGATTSFSLTSVTGLPSIGTDQYIPALVVDTSTTPETVKELVYITAVTGSGPYTATVVRAAEDASRFPAAALASGLTVAQVGTASSLVQLLAPAVHGSTAAYPRPPGALRVYWEGSVAPSNGSAGDQWRDTTLNATRTLVGTAWYYPPGFELGYQERTTNDTTSNTSRASASSNTISGLTISGVVGTGQAVDIEFYCSAVLTDVAASYAAADLVVGGTGAAEQLAAADSPSTSTGRTLLLRRRKVLTAGTSYTFDVGKYAQSGVTTATYAAAAANPMYLSVTCR